VDKSEHLRPQFVASLHNASGMSMTTLGGSDIQQQISATQSIRDLKILASIPVILVSSLILGTVITAIFILEAFLTHLYSGPGKQVIGLLPTLIFVGVVPTIVAAYHRLSVRMTGWERWPTQGGWDGSLTVKTL
jgi:anoctamin-10